MLQETDKILAPRDYRSIKLLRHRHPNFTVHGHEEDEIERRRRSELRSPLAEGVDADDRSLLYLGYYDRSEGNGNQQIDVSFDDWLLEEWR